MPSSLLLSPRATTIITFSWNHHLETNTQKISYKRACPKKNLSNLEIWYTNNLKDYDYSRNAKNILTYLGKRDTMTHCPNNSKCYVEGTNDQCCSLKQTNLQTDTSRRLGLSWMHQLQNYSFVEQTWPLLYQKLVSSRLVVSTSRGVQRWPPWVTSGPFKNRIGVPLTSQLYISLLEVVQLSGNCAVCRGQTACRNSREKAVLRRQTHAGWRVAMHDAWERRDASRAMQIGLHVKDMAGRWARTVVGLLAACCVGLVYQWT